MAGIGTNIGWNQVNKKVTKTTRKAIKLADEIAMPHSVMDVAMYSIMRPIKNARLVGGIAKAGAKYVSKIYRNIG